MEKHEVEALIQQVGTKSAARIDQLFTEYQEKAKQIATEAIKQGGFLTQEQFNTQKEAADKVLNELKEIAQKQGTDINQLMEKASAKQSQGKSVAQMLQDNAPKLKEIFNSRVGAMEFLLEQKATGELVMRPFDTRTKAAGTTATIDGIDGGTASISSDLLDSSLLRFGGNAIIQSQYRNTPWIFDLVNVSTSEFVSGMPYVIYYEEVAKQGTAAVVAEGATKPLVQYAYKLVSKEYKKVAQLVSFTEEFSIDYRRLQDDIMNKGRVDILNVVNAAVVTDIISAATAYNTAASFGAVDSANDFDAIAAMAAQVENATYGNMANAAIMSTFKKYRMGVEKDDMMRYLNRPDVLAALRFTGNPGMAADAVVVGDLKQYNLILRGGLIVRVGYNGTDFAENKFSVVMEQFYYDYISDVRKPAIVKGPDFATVRAAIDSQSGSF